MTNFGAFARATSFARQLGVSQRAVDLLGRLNQDPGTFVMDNSVPLSTFPQALHDRFEIKEWRHATAILEADFPVELDEIKGMLTAFKLYKSWITDKGKNKGPLAVWIDHHLGALGWIETQFKTQIKVDEAVRDSPTHKVDCFKNRVALEVEWNNKDPFFDRDLNNFRLLFDLGVISVGVIFTRGDDLQKIFDKLDKGKSYGNSTTHVGKLYDRIDGGGGGGCPLLVIGIKQASYDDVTPAPIVPTKPKKPRKKVSKKALESQTLAL